jgi:hypothetical protein
MSEERVDAEGTAPGEEAPEHREAQRDEDEHGYADENGYEPEDHDPKAGYEPEADYDSDEPHADYDADEDYDPDDDYDYEPDDDYDRDPHDDDRTVEQAALPEGFRPCESCGEPVEPRQLVCLSCGARVALTHGRSFITEPIVPLIVAVVVVGAALFGFAIAEITSDSGEGRQSASQDEAPAPAVVDGERQQPRADGERTETAATRTSPSRPSSPLEWPQDLTAHTVVLVTTGDRAAAVAAAREARSTGLEAGVLPSDPYNLGTDLWIVFSGRFTTPEGASRQAAQLAERYPGAYPQLIQRSQ